MGINTNRPDLENCKPLIPRDAYFGGHVNAVKLYYNCEGTETINGLDITSMYPHTGTMSASQYYYPIKTPTILKKGQDAMLPSNGLLGQIQYTVKPPKKLYFPVLLERPANNSKVVFHLNEMTST